MSDASSPPALLPTDSIQDSATPQHTSSLTHKSDDDAHRIPSTRDEVNTTASSLVMHTPHSALPHTDLYSDDTSASSRTHMAGALFQTPSSPPQSSPLFSAASREECRRAMAALHTPSNDASSLAHMDVSLHQHRGNESALPSSLRGQVDSCTHTLPEHAQRRALTDTNTPLSVTTSPTSAHPGSFDQFCARLTEVYRRYAPHRLGKVEHDLRKYPGREEEVISTARRRYAGENPTPVSASSTKANTNTTNKINANTHTDTIGAFHPFKEDALAETRSPDKRTSKSVKHVDFARVYDETSLKANETDVASSSSHSSSTHHDLNVIQHSHTPPANSAITNNSSDANDTTSRDELHHANRTLVDVTPPHTTDVADSARNETATLQVASAEPHSFPMAHSPPPRRLPRLCAHRYMSSRRMTHTRLILPHPHVRQRVVPSRCRPCTHPRTSHGT